MDEVFKMIVCAGLAVACFSAPMWVPAVVGTEVPRSDEVECVQPEDEWCSGATPECPSHWEAYDLGFTSYEAENSLPPSY